MFAFAYIFMTNPDAGLLSISNTLSADKINGTNPGACISNFHAIPWKLLIHVHIPIPGL